MSPDYGIRADAAGALGYLEDGRAFEPLVRAFYEDTDWLVRFSAAVALGNLKDPRAVDVLRSALKSQEVVMLQGAIAALGEIGDPSVVEDILPFVTTEDWLVRQRLAEALGNLPSPKTQAALEYLAKDEHPHVATAAQISLQRLQERLSSEVQGAAIEIKLFAHCGFCHNSLNWKERRGIRSNLSLCLSELNFFLTSWQCWSGWWVRLFFHNYILRSGGSQTC